MYWMGSAGDPPAPLGGSPDGTGRWPVPSTPTSLVLALPDHPRVDPAAGAAVRIAVTVGVAVKPTPNPDATRETVRETGLARRQVCAKMSV